MKKLLLSLILLLTNFIYCQYKEVYSWNSGVRDEIIKCNGYNCHEGIFSQMENVKCINCADWADSYRNSRGCDVCHNNKYITKRVTHTCYTCNGLGKVRNTYYTKENIANREDENKCETLRNKINTIDYPTKLEIAESLLGRKVDNWSFDKLDEFGKVNILDYLGVKDINCNDLKESTYTVEVELTLRDFKTQKNYEGKLKLKFKYFSNKWIFSEIVSGYVRSSG